MVLFILCPFIVFWVCKIKWQYLGWYTWKNCHSEEGPSQKLFLTFSQRNVIWSNCWYFIKWLEQDFCEVLASSCPVLVIRYDFWEGLLHSFCKSCTYLHEMCVDRETLYGGIIDTVIIVVVQINKMFVSFWGGRKKQPSSIYFFIINYFYCFNKILFFNDVINLQMLAGLEI